MPEIRQSITTPTNFITTTGTDVGSSIGHSTPAQVRTALGIASGFTYDQQAEPSSPTAGETWRERTAGGLIVEQWEWNSSSALWLSITRHRSVTSANSSFLPFITATGSQFVVLNPSLSPLNHNIFLDSARMRHRQAAGGTIDSTNFWTFDVIGQDEGGLSQGSAYGSFILNNTNSTVQASQININLLTSINQSGVIFRYTATGSPAGLRFGGAINYRMVRQ